MKRSSSISVGNVNLDQLIKSISVDFDQLALDELVGGEIKNFCLQLGIIVAQKFLEAEAKELAGDKYNRDDGKEPFHWGSQKGSIRVGGAKVKIKKPRVRRRDESGTESEVPLETYEAFNRKESLNKPILNRLLSGVSGRDFARTVESVGDTIGLSKSTYSRKASEAAQIAVEELYARDIGGLHLVALLIDGTKEGGFDNIVAVGVSEDGRKHMLGIEQGSSENATVCKTLLQDLVDRGLDPGTTYLFILDGSKALRRAVEEIFGNRAVIQRCIVHKLRNILDHLPELHHDRIRTKLKAAWSMNDSDEALQALKDVHKQLAAINASAAKSLAEGMEETLTLHRLRLPTQLRRSFATTNIIESWFSTAKTHSRRVKRWKGTAQVRRWLILGMLEAERRSHKIDGFKYLKTLRPSLIEYVAKKRKMELTARGHKKRNRSVA